MKVLAAEDGLVMRELLASSLRRWNYEVYTANDGATAWNLFQQIEFPIVVTDWIMPGIDGIELIKRIRAHDAGKFVHIVLLTSKNEKSDLIDAMDAGADDFLPKPFDQDELRVRLRAGERVVTLERTLSDQYRQLREAQSALVESEKLASLGQLSAGLAHEINNPIAYVNNNLAVLRRDVESVLELLDRYRDHQDLIAQHDKHAAATIAQLEEEADLDWIRESNQRLFDESANGLERVREIVGNLRDFARLDAAELDDIDLATSICSTIDVMKHLIDSAGLEVVVELDELPEVACQPSKINQLLYNLFLNAIQASEAGQRVDVRLCGIDDYAVLEIEDNGCGIAKDDLPRIFDPFFTTRPIGEGAGLGLAVSFGVVRDHGGHIEVKSKVDVGSLFRVRLPIRPPVKA